MNFVPASTAKRQTTAVVAATVAAAAGRLAVPKANSAIRFRLDRWSQQSVRNSVTLVLPQVGLPFITMTNLHKKGLSPRLSTP